MNAIFKMSPFGLGDHSFRSVDSMQDELAPIYHCNPAWDPGCPRPGPNRTVAPYLPSSYLMGVVYSPAVLKPRPRDRSGRLY